MNTRIFIQRTLLILFGSALLAWAVSSGYEVYIFSHQRAEIKKDYSVANNITYGLLSVNSWRDHLVNIVTNRIDDFELTREQEDTLEREIAQVLHAVVNKASTMVNKKQKTLGGKLKKFAFKTFVKEDKIHSKVPEFAETIVKEIKKPKNKARLKFLAKSKLEEFGSVTYDSANDVIRMEDIFLKYQSKDLSSFNEKTQAQLGSLQHKTYRSAYIMLGILVVFLLMWWMFRHNKVLHTPFFVLSVLLALVVLITGLLSPMIEIDARIKQMSFLLLGEQISFNDQVIFFQSKSIVDVVRILIETGKYDSMVVGVLILVFSILFPILKLLSTKVYLLGNKRVKENKIIQYFAFKSGKWSMADVNVVAIFMAYIGFKGILDSQMESLNLKTQSLASISTNQTSLQPGFILFVGFVMFSLFLSVILQHITHLAPKKKEAAVKNSSSPMRPSVA